MAGQVLGNKVAAKDLTEEVDPPCHSNYQTHKRIKSILLNVCRRLHRLLLDSQPTAAFFNLLMKWNHHHRRRRRHKLTTNQSTAIKSGLFFRSLSHYHLVLVDDGGMPRIGGFPPYDLTFLFVPLSVNAAPKIIASNLTRFQETEASNRRENGIE